MENKILIAVKKANLQTIKKYLEPLDLSEYNIMSAAKLLNDILDIIRARQPIGKIKTLDVILEKWQDAEDNDLDLLVSELGSIIIISQENLAYIVETYGNVIPEEVLTYNILNESKEKAFTFGFLTSRIITIWKNKDIMMRDGWLRLLKLAKEKDRKDAIGFILKYLEKDTGDAEIPKWMRKAANKVSSLVEDPNTTKDEIKNIITKSTDSFVVDKLSKALNGFSHTELSSIISSFGGDKYKTIDDPDMVEGPINPIVYEDGTSRDCLGAMSYRNNKSCRMLTCLCVVNNEIDFELDEIPKLYWFNGKCEECQNKIQLVCHCIRLPLDNGGWAGCFCSENCAIETANKEIKENLGANSQGLERYRKFNGMAAIIRFKGIVENKDSFFIEDVDSSIKIDETVDSLVVMPFDEGVTEDNIKIDSQILEPSSDLYEEQDELESHHTKEIEMVSKMEELMKETEYLLI